MQRTSQLVSATRACLPEIGKIVLPNLIEDYNWQSIEGVHLLSPATIPLFHLRFASLQLFDSANSLTTVSLPHNFFPAFLG